MWKLKCTFLGGSRLLVFAVDSHRYAKHCILQSIFPHHLSLKVHSMQIKTFFLKVLTRKYVAESPSKSSSVSRNLSLRLLTQIQFTLQSSSVMKNHLSYKLWLLHVLLTRVFLTQFFCANNTLKCCDTWQVSTKYMQNGTVTVLIVYDSISQKCFQKHLEKLGWKTV